MSTVSCRIGESPCSNRIRGRREYTAAVRGRLAKWQANRAMGYGGAHVDARLKVSEIARVVHLSSRFSRAFKRTFGMTVHAWVMRRRIELAQGMMLGTPHKLSEIALRCGSATVALDALFRRVVGETPGSWRRDRYEPNRWGGFLAVAAHQAGDVERPLERRRTSSSAASTLAA